MASVSWASAEIEPYDMAPVEKRRTIDDTGSTSSSGTGDRPVSSEARRRNSPRKRPQPRRLVVDGPGVLLEDVVARASGSSAAACAPWSGLKRWNSPSRRHWYSPPTSRSR